MQLMPKRIDAEVKERCVRHVLEHLPEYPSLTAAGPQKYLVGRKDRDPQVPFDCPECPDCALAVTGNEDGACAAVLNELLHSTRHCFRGDFAAGRLRGHWASRR